MSPGSLLAGDSGMNLSRDTDSRTAVRGGTSQALNLLSDTNENQDG